MLFNVMRIQFYLIWSKSAVVEVNTFRNQKPDSTAIASYISVQTIKSFYCNFPVSRHMMRYVIGEYKQCTQNSDCNDASEQKCVDKICRCPIGTVLHYGKCTASLSK